MCPKQQARIGEQNLRVLNKTPKRTLTLEELENRRLIETIEIEQELERLTEAVYKGRSYLK